MMNFIVKSITINNEKDYCKNRFKEINLNDEYCKSNHKLYLPLFLKCINQNDNVLVRGSNVHSNELSLAIQISDSGFHKHVTNVNKNEAAVQEMSCQFSTSHPFIKFLVMDFLQTSFESESFDCILDEGPIESNITDDFHVIIQNKELYQEIDRIVKVGGRYVFISLLPHHMILNGPIAYFYNLGWDVRIFLHNEDKTIKLKGNCISLPLFGIVCTKMEKSSSLIEFCTSDTGGEQLSSLEDLVNRIQSLQNLASIHDQIRSLGDGHLSCEISMDIFDPNSKTKTFKYRLYILDRDIESTHKFVVFVVPQGRENDTIFKAKEGRIKFANDAQFERLVLVHLGRDHSFKNLELVQDELTNLICSFQPNNLPPNTKIPFMSLSDKINQRKEIYRGVSDFTGEFAIEEVEDEEDDGTLVTLRLLVFISEYKSLVQTEARLNEQGEVDIEHLISSYQVTMVDELSNHLLLNRSGLDNVLVIGLGGGLLCSHLHVKFPELNIEAVEIDPSVIEIAEQYFGLNTGPNLKVHCADGLTYMRDLRSSDTGFGCIILDIDCKDSTISLFCPPPSFLEKSFISCLETCLKPNGLLLINFCVLDDESLKEELLQNFRESFSNVELKKSKEAFNEIIVCSKNG